MRPEPQTKVFAVFPDFRSAAGAGAENAGLSLGIESLDRVLGGGLAGNALHEIVPHGPIHLCAATGFAQALCACCKTCKPILFIQSDFARQEAGLFYGPGLDLFGLASADCLVVRAPRAVDAFYAMEEALKSGAVSAVITELAGEGESADLTATRRLSLAARAGNKPGFLLRHRLPRTASAAMTRWSITAAPGARDCFGGLSATAFHSVLLKNRRGACGEWILQWDHHARAFIDAAHSLGLAATACDRQIDAPRSRAG